MGHVVQYNARGIFSSVLCQSRLRGLRGHLRAWSKVNQGQRSTFFLNEKHTFFVQSPTCLACQYASKARKYSSIIVHAVAH